VVDFAKIFNVYIGKMIFQAIERIFNSDKICRSYSDNFGVTFLEHSVYSKIISAIRNSLYNLKKIYGHRDVFRGNYSSHL